MFRLFIFLVSLLFWNTSAFSQTNERVSAYKLADSAIKLIPINISQDSARSEVYRAIAWKYKTINIDLSIEFINKAIDIADSFGVKSMLARSIDTKGVIYQIKSNYSQALFYHLQALRIYQSLNNNYKIDQAGCIGNIASVFINLNNYKLAQKYNTELVNLGIDHPFLIMAYSNMGLIENSLGNEEQGLVWYKKAIAAGVKYNDKASSVPALTNLASYYTKIGKLDSATYYCQSALKSVSNDSYYQASIYETLGLIESKQKNYEAALGYLKKAESIAKSKELNLSLIEIYRQLALVYEYKNDVTNSYSCFKKYTAIKDTSINFTTAKQIAEMQGKYETEKKDNEIIRLNHAKQMADEKAYRENITRNFFVVAFILILVVSIILVRNVQFKQRINVVLSEKNQELSLKNNELVESKVYIETQKQQIEKINKDLQHFNLELLNENVQAKYEVLKSKINPHFLFNSLSTLSSIVIHDKDIALDYIGKFAELYRIILETEEQQLISIEKEMAVVENYLYIQKMRFNECLIIDINVLSKNVPLGLPPFSVQMSVENAIKHNIISKKRPLMLSITLNENNIVIKNTLQKNMHQVASTSTGQKNIIDRYRVVANIKPDFTETANEYIVSLPLITLLKEVEA